MKVTREIIDNGMKIIHINYEKKDIEEMRKRVEEDKLKEVSQKPNED